MLQEFISHVKNSGLARNNRFSVNIGFPASVTSSYTYRLTSIFCESASIPGYNIATQPHRIFGESREVPYQPMYDPVSLTFLLDTDFTIKTAFEILAIVTGKQIGRAHV